MTNSKTDDLDAAVAAFNEQRAVKETAPEVASFPVVLYLNKSTRICTDPVEVMA